MKKDLLTVKELAAELRMSPKSIQRAYRKGEIPVQWLCRMAGSIWRKSNGRRNRTEEAACVVSTAHRNSRARQAARTTEKSPDGKTGAGFPGFLTEGLMNSWTCCRDGSVALSQILLLMMSGSRRG